MRGERKEFGGNKPVGLPPPANARKDIYALMRRVQVEKQIITGNGLSYPSLLSPLLRVVSPIFLIKTMYVLALVGRPKSWRCDRLKQVRRITLQTLIPLICHSIAASFGDCRSAVSTPQ